MPTDRHSAVCQEKGNIKEEKPSAVKEADIEQGVKMGCVEMRGTLNEVMVTPSLCSLCIAQEVWGKV